MYLMIVYKKRFISDNIIYIYMYILRVNKLFL